MNTLIFQKPSSILTPIALYFHIPYCSHKCPYCDFNTYAVTQVPEERYQAALLLELEGYAKKAALFGRVVTTIYFGGGTPSLFSPESIGRIIEGVSKLLPVHEPLEITLEANPGTMTEEKLDGFAYVGINRLSLGAQSFQPRILDLLGRRHAADHIERAVAFAQKAGIKNISLDLIFGVPEQTVDELSLDLEALLSLHPQHVSLYGLTIEEGTPFFRDVHEKKIFTLSDDCVAEMMQVIHARLAADGLKRYEISNYARPGYESKHNRNYWSGGDYLGVGAGAHSGFLSETPPLRWSNRAKPLEYMEQVEEKGEARAWTETLDERKVRSEFFMLGLRRSEGVSAESYKNRFNRNLQEDYSAVLTVLADAGLIHWDSSYLRLTDSGVLVADTVIEEFIPEK